LRLADYRAIIVVAHAGEMHPVACDKFYFLFQRHRLDDRRDRIFTQLWGRSGLSLPEKREQSNKRKQSEMEVSIFHTQAFVIVQKYDYCITSIQ
jgi:hypothetical protein